MRGADFQDLTRLKRLKSLGIAASRVTDEELQILAGLKSLESLNLNLDSLQSTSPKEWLGGKNNVGTDHYFGPCGPSGHALHHYVITVMATDMEPGAFKPGLTREELLAMLRGHSLAPASIVGRYTRPTP